MNNKVRSPGKLVASYNGFNVIEVKVGNKFKVLSKQVGEWKESGSKPCKY